MALRQVSTLVKAINMGYRTLDTALIYQHLGPRCAFPRFLNSAWLLSTM